MSSKINSTTKTVLVLTVLSYIILALYISIFHGESRFPDFLTSFLSFIFIIGAILAFICCIIGFIGGLAGIFGKKANLFDRVICIFCTLLCFNSIIYIFSPPAGSATESQRRISCASNLKQIFYALQQYAADFAGNYPPGNGAVGLEVLRKNEYLNAYEIYACPSAATARGKDKQPLTEEIVDYVYFGGLNTKSDPELPLVCDKANNHQHFVNVLFVGGTTKGIEGNPWTTNIKK